jgi:hypothetical protein
MVIYKIVGYRGVGRRRTRVVRWSEDDGLAKKTQEALTADGFDADVYRVEAPTRSKRELIEWLNRNAAE